MRGPTPVSGVRDLRLCTCALRALLCHVWSPLLYVVSMADAPLELTAIDASRHSMSSAHEQLKGVLAHQQQVLARMEAEEAERKESTRRARNYFHEQHVKAQQEEATKQQLKEGREKQQARDKQQLHEVFDELLATEATYLADLILIRDRYLVPLRKLLPPTAHHTIFSNLEILVQLHSTLGEDLQPARESASEATDGAMGGGTAGVDTARGRNIAQAFLKLAPFFKMYAAYSAQYAHVPEALEKAQRERAVGAFLKRAASAPAEEQGAEQQQQQQASRDAGLGQLLFRPVQRMCLYPLLFKQALAAKIRVDAWSETDGKTDGKSGVRQQLEQVFEVIQQTLGHVNEDVRGLEARFHTMQVLTSDVSGGQAFVTPDRVLRHECHVDMRGTVPVQSPVRAHNSPKSRANSSDLNAFASSSRAGVQMAWLCGSCSPAPHDAARRRFVWYVFSDGVLICRNRMPITDGVLSPNEITVTPARAKLGLHRMSNAVRATIAPGSVSSSGPGAFSATTSSDLGVEVHHACWAEGGEPAMSALIEAVHAMQQAATRNTTRRTELEGTDTEF